MKKLFTLFIPVFMLLSCSDKNKSQNLYSQAISEYQQRNFPQAIELTKQALKENHNFPEAEFLKAKSFFFSKDFKTAEKLFSKLCSKHSDNFDYRLWLLRTYYFSADYQKASDCLTKMQKINSEDWRIYYWRALISKAENDFESYFRNLGFAEETLKESSVVYRELSFIWMELGMADRYVKYSEKNEVLQK